MAFDRLIYIDRLKQAGLDESMARAHADALRDALLETVATQADVKDVQHKLETQIKELHGAMHDVRTDIKTSRAETTAEFKTLRAEMQLMSRDLFAKGAAALVVVTSILIGIKFFG